MKADTRTCTSCGGTCPADLDTCSQCFYEKTERHKERMQRARHAAKKLHKYSSIEAAYMTRKKSHEVYVSVNAQQLNEQPLNMLKAMNIELESTQRFPRFTRHTFKVNDWGDEQ